jgi:hypothetical protein
LLQFLVIKALDPDWILIGIHPKILDPDPDEMKADPQPCLGLLPQGVPPHRLNAAAVGLHSVQFCSGVAGCFNCLRGNVP